MPPLLLLERVYIRTPYSQLTSCFCASRLDLRAQRNFLIYNTCAEIVIPLSLGRGEKSLLRCYFVGRTLCADPLDDLSLNQSIVDRRPLSLCRATKTQDMGQKIDVTF